MQKFSACLLVASAFFGCLMAAMMPQLNISMQDISGNSFEVGQAITLNWTSNCSDLSEKDSVMVMIELMNDRAGVMLEPMIVASNLSCLLTSFSWTVPGFLTASPDYHLRLSQQTPIGNTGSKLLTHAFELKNPAPGRHNTLDLIEPTGSLDGSSYESTCLLGERCWVLWNYPEGENDSAIPQLIDIKLFAGDQLALTIAQNVPLSQKNYLWQVPNDASLSGPLMHVVIQASGKKLPVLVPGSAYYLASSGYPFKLETRADREKRWAAEGRTPVDTPIATQTTETSLSANQSAIVDVPRPTFYNPSAISSSDAQMSELNLILLVASFIGAMLLI